MDVLVGTALTNAILERALAAGSPAWDAHARFGARVHREGIYFDLSEVRFADFSAIARVLLIAEAACREGIQTEVELPNTEATIEERQRIDDAPDRPSRRRRADEVIRMVRRRRRALHYLRATGFSTAIKMPHLTNPPIAVSEPVADALLMGLGEDEPDSDEAVASDADDAVEPWETTNLAASSRILPFRWISTANSGTLPSFEALAAILFGLRQIGLDPGDAERLAYTVVHELVENIATHAPDSGAPAPHALFGAVLLSAGTIPFVEVRGELRAFAEWAARSGSSVVRLVVADSGTGVATRLLHQLPAIEVTELAGIGSGYRDTERATLWAFVAPGRATRGLRRVQRIVRSYRGAVMIRSADAMAGFVYGAAPKGQAVAVPGLRPTIGTFVDITLLPQAQEASLVATPGRGVPGTSTMRWARLVLDRRQMVVGVTGARELASSGADIVLTFDVHAGARITPEQLGGVMLTASELAASSFVALVLGRLDPLLVESAVEDLHLGPPGTATGEAHRAPFLLIDQTGSSRWCGGAPDLRTVLQRLTDDGGVPAAGDQTLDRLLAEYPRLAVRSGSRIVPAVTPTEVVSQLMDMVSRALRQAIERGDVGVQTGRFRTPNLRVVDRWIDPDVLLEHVAGLGTIAFLLARQLLSDVPGATGPGTSIIQVGPASRGLAETLGSTAGARGRTYVMADEFDSPTRTDHVRSDRSLVLCGDVMLTGNSMRRAVAEVLSWGANPVAIVTAIDGRSVDEPFEVYGRRVPIIRLARVTLEPTAGSPDEVVDIDPVLRAPVHAAPSRPAYIGFAPDAFITAIAEVPNAIGLGHVERWTNRHFTAYLNAPLIIDSGNPMRDVVADSITTEVSRWRRGSDQNRLVVYVPGSAESYASPFAELVAGRVRRSLDLVEPVEIVEVPRYVAGSRWAFPDRLDPRLTSASDVLLVDWGSLDAVTVTQLVRLAAGAGARRVLAIVVLSQMSAHEEQALTMIRAVDGSSAEGEPSPDGAVVSVRIRFLTGLALPALGRGECPLCQLAAQLNGDLEDGRLPATVARHVRDLAEHLVPVSRDAAIRRSTDAFGVPIGSPAAAAYIRLRAMLAGALRATAERQRVADFIADLATRLSQADTRAVVRLLAAERQWLKLPPLRFDDLRADVSTIVRYAAESEENEPRLRVQAVLVLASAAPEDFVRHLVTLWRSALKYRELQLHLIYQVHRLLRRRPGDLPVGLELLRERVEQCRGLHRSGRTPERLPDDLDWLLTSLLYAVERETIARQSLDARAAWVALVEHRYLDQLNDHSAAEAAIVRLLWQMETPPASQDDLDHAVVGAMWRSWRAIEAFLHNHVLPFLPPLRNILLGPFVQEHLLPAERARLERLLLSDGAGEVAQLGSRLRELLHRRTLDMGWLAQWNEVAVDLQWLQQVVVSAGDPPVEPADLAMLLRACPASVTDVLTRTVKEAAARNWPVQIELPATLITEPVDLRVFCPQDLLADATQQVVRNAATHRAPGEESSVVRMEVLVDASPDEVVVTFRNTGTVPVTQPGKGRGIAGIRDQLTDFLAHLEVLDPPDPWTFAVELRLQRWSKQAGDAP